MISTMNRNQYIAIVFAGGLLASGCATKPAPVVKAPVKAAPPKPKATSSAEILAGANQKFEAGEYAEAVNGYDKVLAKQPKQPVVLYNRAVALHRLGKLDEAATAYEAVLAESPEDERAALNYGAVLKARAKPGDLDKAIKIYSKALEKKPFDGSLLNNISVLYREKKQYNDAVNALRTLLMRDQKNIDAYKNLALVYYDQKKFKLTQTILENALKMATEQKREDPDIYVNLGMVYLSREENGKAMAAFKKAIAIDPNHLAANYNIGALALGHRDYGLAAKSYEVVAKARPGQSYVAASLGYAYQGLQQLDEAKTWLEKARTLKLKEATAGPGAVEDDEEQMILQLMIISQGKEDSQGALKYADEYMKKKGITCGPEDFEGFCGRVNGIKMMIEMAKEAAAAPVEEPVKPKATGQDIFTDGEVEGEAAPEGAEGAAPTEGEAPVEGEAPAGGAEGNP